ncbi:MAG TPA: class I SAM-dependent methyltransferase [Anaerolineales bacterium]|nr:class I SAM-dependent methyltransferase [Anaerolineales bacterium]
MKVSSEDRRVRRRLRFELRYWTGRPPWDTGITPPEVMDFLARTPPGRAVDFGCGTGTNAITLAQHTWQVTGIDFSWRALRTARRKARAAGVAVQFLRRDVSRLDDLAGPFDFALDLGCFHSLEPQQRARYAAAVARVLNPRATFMMYAFVAPDEGWPSEAEIRQCFSSPFDLVGIEHGDFEGRPSAWFTWRRRP